MKIKTISVEKGEYVIIKREDQITAVDAMSLNKDIAFSFFIKGMQCAGLARAVEIFKVKEIFNLFDLDPQLHKVQVNVVGGDDSDESIQYANDLLLKLKEIDDGQGIVEITHSINLEIHPNFCVILGEDLM